MTREKVTESPAEDAFANQLRQSRLKLSAG